ncbi:retrovirus-related pol polyprotein from transposon TNT 1-94 [Tanacetum coccineum]
MFALNNSNNSNQQILADSGANAIPPMLKNGNYIPWESRFRRLLDNQLEEGEKMWNSIQHGPYQRPLVPNPDNLGEQILEPLSKMTEGDKKKYIADWQSTQSFSIACNQNGANMLPWAKKAAKNHDPLALIAHSNASSSYSHANSSYSPQSYYVMHLPSVVDYDDKYQGEFSSPTNNRLRVSSNIKNQAVVQDGRVDIQTKNAGYGGNANKNMGRNRNQMFNAGNASDESNQIVQRVPRTDSTPNKANVQCYNCNEKGHYARDCQKLKVHDAKYFREQMLLAMKDEAGSLLSNEENDFMLDNAYGEESLDELTASVMLMARLQPADGTTDTVPSYDEKAVSQVHDSSKAHEQVSHVKRKTIIQTTDDAQIDSSIIFDDPYVDNNGGTSKHDSIAHEEYHEIQMLAYTVQREAEKQKRLNNELKKQKDLLQQELETFKDQIKTFESQTVQCSKYKETCDDLKYMLHSEKLIIDSTNSEETLEDAEESRIKMRNKMIQINYKKINALYDTFIPQREFSADQTYFSIPSTSNNSSESKDVPSESLVLKMPSESRLLKMINKLGDAITGLHTMINKTLLKDVERRWLFDSQNELREFYKTNVILMSRSLYKNLKDIKEEFIEEVQEMLNIFESMEQKVNEKSPTEILLQKEIDRLLEVSLTSEIQNYVLLSAAQQKHDLLKDELEKTSSDSKDIQTNLLNRIKILKNDFQRSQAQITRAQHQKEVDKLIQCVNQKTYAYGDVRAKNQDLLMTISELKSKLKTIEKGKNVNTKFDTSETLGKSVGSSHSVRRSTSKDNKSKNSILKNTKSSSTYVWKTLNSDCLDSNKCDTKTSNVCQTNACISNFKTVKACVNVVNDGSNIVCISYGNDVFLNSHKKCVARHALSRNSSVKRALFTSPLATQYKNLGATSVVTKSRLSVAKTPTATSKVSSALTPSSNSSKTRTLSSYMNNKITTSRKWQKWFEYQHGLNWTPRSKSAQSQSSITKSKTSVRPKTRTPVTTQKWVVKLSTLPSAFVSCNVGDPACSVDC